MRGSKVNTKFDIATYTGPEDLLAWPDSLFWGKKINIFHFEGLNVVFSANELEITK